MGRVACSVQYVSYTLPESPEKRLKAIQEVITRYCAHMLQGSGSVAGLQQSPGAVIRPAVDATNVMKPNDLRVVVLSGGITNEMYHVYREGREAHSVVMRVFGKETDRVIFREDELFYQSCFIQTYVRGDNFLVYQYLHGYEPLPFTEMMGEHEKAARGIAAFHVRATLEARSDYGGVTLGGGPVDQATGRSRFDMEENYTIHSLTQWAEQIRSEAVLLKVNPAKREDYRSVAHQLTAEALRVLELLRKHSSELGESTCHNDLLSANIMRNKRDGTLKIIDFEYAKRNYFLFDIANHFNEYTGLECDYATYFPPEEHMERFITTYMCAMQDELRLHADEAKRRQLTDIIPQQERFFLYRLDGAEGDKRIRRMVKLVKLLTLASHLSWGIWSLFQEAVSTSGMDFLEYSRLRLSRYFETREEFGLLSE